MRRVSERWSGRFLFLVLTGLLGTALLVGLVGWDTGPGVAVEGGTLPADQDEVWLRVTALTGRDVEPPERIELTRALRDSYPLGGGFHSLLGLSGTRFPSSEPGGVVSEPERIVLRPTGSETEVEAILVHEYTHVVQKRVGVFSYRGPSWKRPPTTDAGYAWRAATEGAAEYVTAAYVRRFMENASIDDVEPRTDYEETEGGNRLFASRYHFGYRYVAHRVDSPEDLSPVYDDPPNTTEQVLHNYTREEEPPAPLSVRVAGERDDWTLGERDTLGELFVRVALSEELPESEAATAAAGWGNDRLVPFENLTTARDPLANWSVQEGYAWVLRWDTVEDADEFESAFRRYLDRRTGGTRDGELWRDGGEYFRVERANPDTVVVFAGTTALLRNGSVSVDGSRTVIRLPAWRPERPSDGEPDAETGRAPERPPTVSDGFKAENPRLAHNGF